MASLRGNPDSQINGVASSSRVNGMLCGRFLEVSFSPENVYKGQQDCIKGGGEEGKEPETPEAIKARSAARARRTVRRLCNCNNMVYMHTLTFAVNHIKYFQGERPFNLVPIDNTKDRDKVILLWKEFARRMRRKRRKKGEEFNYIAVIERHTGKRANDTTIKKDCYHIHFVSDVLYHKRRLQHLWRHGLCNHSDWTKGRKRKDLDEQDTLPAPDNPGAYLSKYIGKDAEDVERSRKSYWTSKGLQKPVPLADNDVLQLAIGNKCIYTKDRLVKVGDDEFVRFTNSTYLLPDTREYDKQVKTDTRPKEYRRKRAAMDRLYNNLYQRRKADEQRKNMDRGAGKRSIDKALEGKRAYEQKATDASREFDLQHQRDTQNGKLRNREFTARKRRITRKIIGKARADTFLQHSQERIIFRSKQA